MGDDLNSWLLPQSCGFSVEFQILIARAIAPQQAGNFLAKAAACNQIAGRFRRRHGDAGKNQNGAGVLEVRQERDVGIGFLRIATAGGYILRDLARLRLFVAEVKLVVQLIFFQREVQLRLE